MMWAITIVQKRELDAQLAEDDERRDARDDLGGHERDRASSTLAAGLQRVRARTRPIASAVPRSVATIIVITAISSETKRDSRRVESFRNSSYHWSEKPWNDCSDLTELNEKRTTTAIGRNRNA